MPSVICKFESFWAYLLPPIRYPDGARYLKIGHGTWFERPLATRDDAAAWLRGDGDAEVLQCLGAAHPHLDAGDGVLVGRAAVAQLYASVQCFARVPISRYVC